jgi:hypothetical protein
MITLPAISDDAFKEMALALKQRRPAPNPAAQTLGAVDSGHGEILWALINFYLDGGKVSYEAQVRGLGARDNFLLSEDIIKSMLDMIELPVGVLPAALPADHPFLVLTNALDFLKNNAAAKLIGTKDAVLNLPANAPGKAAIEAQSDEQHAFLEKIIGKLIALEVAAGPNPEIQVLPLGGVALAGLDYQLTPGDGAKPIQVVTAIAPVISADQQRALDQAKAFTDVMRRSGDFQQQLDVSIKKFTNTTVAGPGRARADALIAGRAAAPAGGARPKVTVVGMGPTGLFAALDSYRAGADVTLVEKRESYTRNNLFRFTPEFVANFKRLFVDGADDVAIAAAIARLPDDHPVRVLEKFQNLKGPQPSPLGDFYQISVKDFERLTEAVVSAISSRDPAGMKIYRGYQYVPNSLAGLNKSIEIKAVSEIENLRYAPTLNYGPGGDMQLQAQKVVADLRAAGNAADADKIEAAQRPIKIDTDYLLDTSGGYAVVKKDTPIATTEMSDTAHYATFTFHLDRAQAPNPVLPPPGAAGSVIFSPVDYTGKVKPPAPGDIDMNALKTMGWQQAAPPLTRFFTTGDHPYIGMDLPASLYNTYNILSKEMANLMKTAARIVDPAAQEKAYQDILVLNDQRDTLLLDWGKKVMAKHFTPAGIDSLNLKSSAAFPATLVKSDQATWAAPSGMQVCLAGDSYQSAHFFTGVGAIRGVQEGKRFATMVQQIIAGTPEADALASYNKDLEGIAYELHYRAFNFPIATDNLQVKPTQAFLDWERHLHPANAAIRAEVTRKEQISGGKGLATTPEEAQVKSLAQVKRKGW